MAEGAERLAGLAGAVAAVCWTAGDALLLGTRADPAAFPFLRTYAARIDPEIAAAMVSGSTAQLAAGGPRRVPFPEDVRGAERSGVRGRRGPRPHRAARGGGPGGRVTRPPVPGGALTRVPRRRRAGAGPPAPEPLAVAAAVPPAVG